MAWKAITGIPPQFSKDGDELASGYYLKFYTENTTSVIDMAANSTGGTLLQKAKLNSLGYPISNPALESTIFIPHLEEDYRAVLYPTEADADGDITANAIWNVPSTEVDVILIGDAADVTLRATTIQTQDDYDRSRLFTDGDGFTAGAGPHVITVPTDYTPTNADFRAYRADASNIYVALIPTATTATTFTLGETLLSTDTIFIGDDSNRNQFDGDAAGNRARLDVPSNSEALLGANNLSDVDSVITSRENLGIELKTIFTGDKQTIVKADLTGGVWPSGLMNVYWASTAAAAITSIGSTFFVPGSTLIGRANTSVTIFANSTGRAELVFVLSPGAESLTITLLDAAGVFVSNAYIRSIETIPCIGL